MKKELIIKPTNNGWLVTYDDCRVSTLCVYDLDLLRAMTKFAQELLRYSSELLEKLD